MRERSKCRVALILLALLLAAVSARASGFRNPPEGASALGRTGGKIAAADDASAVTHNPANLVALTNAEAMAAVTILHSEAEYEGPAGSETTEEPWKFLPNIYAVVPLEEDALAFGLGLTTPFGQSTVWDSDGLFRYTAPYFAQLRVVNVNPTVSARLSKHFTAGVGVDLYWSDLQIKQIYPWSQVTGSPLAPDGTAEFTGSGSGYGGNAALAWQPNRRHQVALTYRTPVGVKYEGDCDISGTEVLAGSALDGVARSSSDFDTRIDFPAVAAIGYAFRLTDRIRVEADAEWIEFSKYEEMKLDAHENNVLLPSGTVEQDWKDAWTFGVGADWQVSDRLVARAGYIFLQSPVPDDTLSPTLPDADRHVLSIGLGLRAGGHRLDLAYAYSFFEERDIDDNLNPAYNGEYKLNSHLVGLSYDHRF